MELERGVYYIYRGDLLCYTNIVGYRINPLHSFFDPRKSRKVILDGRQVQEVILATKLHKLLAGLT
jgi:hypothetical protein